MSAKRYILTPEAIERIAECDDEDTLVPYYCGVTWGDLCRQEQYALQECAPELAYELMERGRIEVHRPDDYDDCDE